MAVKKTPPPKPKAKAPVSINKRNGSRIPLDQNSASSKRLAAMTEGNLSPAQRKRADEFVLQYLRDFNATQAFIRTQVGEGKPCEEIDVSYASNAGYQMTRWPYVAQKIQEAMELAEEKNIVTRNEVMFGLKREAHFHGVGASHGARVGSWGKLATILGMDVRKVEASLSLRGGVLVVPAVDGVEAWESRAAAAQAALKEDVRK